MQLSEILKILGFAQSGKQDRVASPRSSHVKNVMLRRSRYTSSSYYKRSDRLSFDPRPHCKEDGKILGCSASYLYKRSKVLGVPVRRRLAEVTVEDLEIHIRQLQALYSNSGNEVGLDPDLSGIEKFSFRPVMVGCIGQ
ncbi:hypothetical protein SRHO_G00107380 [Serrasalmus rhombeus]